MSTDLPPPNPGPWPCPASRRQLLARASAGFGLAALAGILRPPTSLADGAAAPRPRAKRVIFLFMSGGVSHVDSFDPKPALAARAGQPMPVAIERTQFNNNGTILPSQWDFRPRGECGTEISELFPEMARHADKLAVVRSMTAKFSEHAQGNLFMHTGFPFLGYPSAGAWAVYGLGRECDELPGYVVLRSGDAGVPHGGVACFGNGFLPSDTQASMLACDVDPALRNIRPWEPADRQRRRLDYLAALNRGFGEQALPGVGRLLRVLRVEAVELFCGLGFARQVGECGHGGLHVEGGLMVADRRLDRVRRACLHAEAAVERGHVVEPPPLAFGRLPGADVAKGWVGVAGEHRGLRIAG